MELYHQNFVFLFYDSLDDSDDEDEIDRILVFGSKNHLRKLHQSTTWYIDGTFQIAPEIFTQIVIIHGGYAGKALVFVYALLPNKRQESYEVILRSVLQQFSEYDWYNSEPSVVICDFEMSIIRAVERVFRHTTLRLCFFHLNQSSWRKIQELGLQVVYSDENDITIRQFFGGLLSLAFFPVEDVPECLRTFLQTTPRRMTDFVKYIPININWLLHWDTCKRTPAYCTSPISTSVMESIPGS